MDNLLKDHRYPAYAEGWKLPYERVFFDALDFLAAVLSFLVAEVFFAAVWAGFPKEDALFAANDLAFFLAGSDCLREARSLSPTMCSRMKLVDPLLVRVPATMPRICFGRTCPASINRPSAVSTI
jgi:hypothetical protein